MHQEHGDSTAKASEPNEPDNMAPGHHGMGADPDAQAMVIESLRSQIQDLFSQVTQLNTKLVQSYDRVSVLEDDLHVSSSTIRASSLKISQLELERTQHLSALNTGLLVEKSHVTAELNRLMERATEEAAQRGQAESARADIEKDLDDLSASLFSQANTMVAEARLARARSERKVEEAELALKGAEDAVATMQQRMQALQEEKEESDRQAEDMRVIMGKGKWVKRDSQNDVTLRTPRFMSSHAPYQEFLLFITHLRSIHLVSPTPPAMSTLLALPFPARLLTEDSDPTVRLDLAPSLNWLSRRSVLSAIHTGQLVIEPMSSTTLLSELSSSSSSSFSNSSPIIPGINSGNTTISCALCGALIFSPPDTQSSTNVNSRPPSHPLTLSRSRGGTGNTNAGSWSPSALFRSYSPVNNSSNSQVKPVSQLAPQIASGSLPRQQIYIFRLATAPTAPTQVITVPTSLPLISSATPSTSQFSPNSKQTNHQHTQSRSQSTIYPLCTNGWCLTRLRATCTLWAYVRTNVVDKVWEEEVPVLPSPAQAKSSTREMGTGQDAGEKPPVPPRRRGLWGMASALSERAASWGEGDKEREKEKDKTPMTPPPVHPSKRKPPPVSPPPLPKRSEGRRNLPPEFMLAPTTPVQPPPASDGTKIDAESIVNDPQKTDEILPPTQLDASVTMENDPAAPTTLTESNGASFSTPLEEPPSLPDRTPTPDPSAPQPPAVVAPPESQAETPRPLPSVSAASKATRALPTPPPLPRRAAARSHGAMATAALPEPQAPVPDSTVLDPQAATAKTDQVEEASADASASATAANSDTPTEGNSQAAQVPPEPVPAPEEGEKSETASPENTVNGIHGDETSAPPELSRSTPPSSSASVAAAVPAASEGEEAVVLANGAGLDSDGKPKDDGSDQGTKPDEESGEVFIGEATWEERTWKELVKLREDLFWARIGCLR